MEWVLGKEKLTLDRACASPGAERLLYFKHEERAAAGAARASWCVGRTQPDELNRGLAKLNVAFTLPPGATRRWS